MIYSTFGGRTVGRHRHWSDEMDRVLGLSPDTFDGKPESVLMDDYVAKPVHPKVLAEALEKWIISPESRRE